jgi:tight adherence protein C
VFAGIALDQVALPGLAVLAVLVVLLAWRSFTTRDRLTSRLKALERRRVRLRGEALVQSNRSRSAVIIGGGLRRFVEKLKLTGRERTDGTQLKLQRAGLRSPDAAVIYLFCRMVLPLLAAVVAVMVIYVLKLVELSDLMKLVAAVGVVLLGFAAPDIYLGNLTQRRQVVLQHALPEGLDLLTVCAEAGLSLDASLARVSRELGYAQPELAYELNLTSVELSFLPNRSQAFDNLMDRTNMASVRGLVNTLRQTEKFGTPLANSLRVLSAEFRNERLLKAEEKGARLPALMTVPMMIFILPTLFVVILGPGVLRIFDALIK